MEFLILGPLEVRKDGRPVALRAPKQRALLAALLVRANTVVSTEQLIDDLWGDEPPATATNVLQGYVAGLRQILGQAPGDRPYLITRAPGYLLQVQPEESDLHRFERLVEQGRQARAAGAPSQAAHDLRQALSLWRGPILGDRAMHRLRLTTAPRLEERRLAVLEERLEADLALGRHADLIGELKALIVASPLRERLRAQLMLALYRSGRQSEALEVYRDARRELAKEVGIEPGRELERLQRAILTGDASLDLVTDAPARPGSAGTPPLQLPPDIGDFTGRERELARLRSFVRGKRTGQPATLAIPVVAGKAGVGKTALAVRIAHGVRARFPDGQLYVNLRGAELRPLPPGEVLAGFLRALGEAGALPDELEDRTRQYRTRLAGRRVLVVLDNAADEAQVRPLLPASPACGVLITARSRLAGLEAASTIVLDVLEPHEAVALLGRVAGARRVAAEPDAALAIAGLCGYLPLAVRVAGAKLAARPHWRLARLAERLADEHRRLDELTAGDLEVRASVALSYKGRDEALRRAFRMLGLLDGPDFAAWLAGALLDRREEAEEMLERLVEAQLLEIASEGAGGLVRYRFHDLLRVYARERLKDEEPEAARRAALERALGAYLAAAERAARSLAATVPPAGTGLVHPEAAVEPGLHEVVTRDPVGWFTDERASLVAAVELAYRAELWAPVWELAAAMSGFFEMRAHWDEWRRTHELALEAARRAGDQRWEAETLRRLAQVDMDQGRFSEAVDRLDAALPMFVRLADRRGQARVLRSLGVVHLNEGRVDDALTCLHRALPIFVDLSDGLDQASTLRSLGVAERERGRLDAAVPWFDRALAIFQELGDRFGAAVTLHNLGKIHAEQSRTAAAITCFDQCLRSFVDLGDRRGEAYTIRSMGHLRRDQGRPDDAAGLFARCLPIFRQLGDRLGEAHTLYSLGDLLVERGQLTEAEGCFARCLPTFRELHFGPWPGRTLRRIGDVRARQGDPAAAERAWREAAADLRAIDSPEAAEVERLLHAGG
jgi:DNA-binding SARP family transcriptional activator